MFGWIMSSFPPLFRIRWISERTSYIIVRTPKGAYASTPFTMSDMGFGGYLFPDVG
jgi:hypothetical protein